MFSKLRANYNLSNVLVKIFLVLAVMLSGWQEMLGTVNYYTVATFTQYANAFDLAVSLNGASKVLIALASCAVLGVALAFLVPFLSGVFLNLCRIYSVPRAEYGLLANLYCALGFFVNGLLKLINLITPVFMVWGGVLFPFLITLGGFVSFYLVTANLYFNDVTRVHYFKCLLIVGLVVLFLEVI